MDEKRPSSNESEPLIGGNGLETSPDHARLTPNYTEINDDGSSSDDLNPIEDSQSHLDTRQYGVSNFSTIMHIIKGNVGTGILAIPNAFRNSGIVLGTVGLFVLGLVCVHCMHLIVNCSQKLCKKVNKTSLDYAGAAEQSFKCGPAGLRRHHNKARNVVNGFLILTQFGFCCVYILFIAKNIRQVVEILNFDSKSDPRNPKVQVYEIILVILLLPFVMIRDIRYIAPFSTIANIASFVGLGIIGYVLIKPPINDVADYTQVPSLSKFPLYFGTVIYAFEGIGVVLPMENAMKEKRAFPSLFGVLNVGMVTVCVLYIATGFYGYLKFGDGALGSITLNMTGWEGPTVMCIFSFCCFVSYGLQFYVPMQIVNPLLKNNRLTDRFGFNAVEYSFRALMVLITFAVAAVADSYLDLLISLLGCLASSALALIFPPLIHTITFWPDRAENKFFCLIFAKNLIIGVVGVVGFVTGTAISLTQLIQKFEGKPAA